MPGACGTLHTFLGLSVHGSDGHLLTAVSCTYSPMSVHLELLLLFVMCYDIGQVTKRATQPVLCELCVSKAELREIPGNKSGAFSCTWELGAWAPAQS